MTVRKGRRVFAGIVEVGFTLQRLRTRQSIFFVLEASISTQSCHQCGDCGSGLYSAAVTNTPKYFLRIGSIDQRSKLPPQRQIWCRSALTWVSDINGLPMIETE